MKKLPWIFVVILTTAVIYLLSKNNLNSSSHALAASFKSAAVAEPTGGVTKPVKSDAATANNMFVRLKGKSDFSALKGNNAFYLDAATAQKFFHQDWAGYPGILFKIAHDGNNIVLIAFEKNGGPDDPAGDITNDADDPVYTLSSTPCVCKPCCAQ